MISRNLENVLDFERIILLNSIAPFSFIIIHYKNS